MEDSIYIMYMYLEHVFLSTLEFLPIIEHCVLLPIIICSQTIHIRYTSVKLKRYNYNYVKINFVDINVITRA
jgi:hypothetical protein